MDNIPDEENNTPVKKDGNSGESNKWLFLGIFLVVAIIGVCIFYFGSQETVNSFTEGLVKFAGEAIWQSM
jgi:hypothetical protein